MRRVGSHTCRGHSVVILVTSGKQPATCDGGIYYTNKTCHTAETSDKCLQTGSFHRHRSNLQSWIPSLHRARPITYRDDTRTRAYIPKLCLHRVSNPVTAT